MRTAFLTGASRGIGAAIADVLRARGIDVIAPTRAELDLGAPDAVEHYLQAHPFTADILIHNAGINHPKATADLTLDDFRAVMDVNLTAAFLLTRAAAPAMASRGFGRIVHIASVYASLGRVGRAAYGASKSALLGLTRMTAVEYGPRGVLINAVSPGFVNTELTRRNNPPDVIAALAAQTALKRLADPDEIARVVAFLASDENTYLTGQDITIDGGFSIQ